jgi:hypothetical protein
MSREVQSAKQRVLLLAHRMTSEQTVNVLRAHIRAEVKHDRIDAKRKSASIIRARAQTVRARRYKFRLSRMT